MNYTVSKWQKASSKPVMTGMYQRRNFWEAIFFNTDPVEDIYHVADDTWYFVSVSVLGTRMYTVAPSQSMQWRGVEYDR